MASVGSVGVEVKRGSGANNKGLGEEPPPTGPPSPRHHSTFPPAKSIYLHPSTNPTTNTFTSYRPSLLLLRWRKPALGSLSGNLGKRKLGKLQLRHTGKSPTHPRQPFISPLINNFPGPPSSSLSATPPGEGMTATHLKSGWLSRCN